jgi:large subunit ribosomal protein L2
MKSKNISELKRYKPTTPSLRGRVIPNYSSVSKVLRDKNLTLSVKKDSGRNSTGRITCRHKGGRHKRSLRYIDINRNTGYYSNVSCVSYEYDPNRSSMIGRCFTGSFKAFYVLAAGDMKKGNISSSL